VLVLFLLQLSSPVLTTEEKFSPVSATSTPLLLPNTQAAPQSLHTYSTTWELPRLRPHFLVRCGSDMPRQWKVLSAFLEPHVGRSRTNPSPQPGLRCIQTGSLALLDRRETASDRRLQSKTSTATKLVPVRAAIVQRVGGMVGAQVLRLHRPGWGRTYLHHPHCRERLSHLEVKYLHRHGPGRRIRVVESISTSHATVTKFLAPGCAAQRSLERVAECFAPECGVRIRGVHFAR